ncbi:MAG: hypothetical protein HKL85_00025 [Acidimicrobiaceae bacterium]|nr:hypothetical protein [Acidimicrobiaceae bacterium]
MEIKGMTLLSTLSLGEGMAGGEGLATHVGARGQRSLFVASEKAPYDFVVADVSDPRAPSVLYRHELVGPQVRSNNLAIHDDLLAVTRQAKDKGASPAGVEFFDISTPAQPRSIGFFDASGGESIGTHFVWLDGAGFAYLASQDSNYAARDPRDQFMLKIIDVSNPSKAYEVGRWWTAGTQRSDVERAPVRPHQRLAAARGVTLTPEQVSARRVDHGVVASWDFGIRVHNICVLPEQPDRAYVASTSGGAFIFDVADKSAPRVVGELQYGATLPGAAHTFVPLGASGFGLLSDETLEEGAADFPQNVWVVDVRLEDRPQIVGTLEMPWPDVVPPEGRFGAHNLHEYPLGQGAWRDFDVAAGAFFGLGVGVYDVSSPLRPREIGRFVPGVDPQGPSQGQLNDVFLDDRAIVYTIDRKSDTCFILELDGTSR